MKILAIESSSMVAGAAVVDDDKVVAEYLLNHKKTHSQILMPLVDEMLDGVDMSLDDIDAFAVSSGPGSFTGLRIGISTIRALAQSIGRPVIGVPTLDGLAYNMAYSKGILCPIMDARREQVYTCIYRWEKNKLVRMEDYMAVPVVQLLDILTKLEGPFIFNGDGVAAYRHIIEKEMGDNALFAPAHCAMQRPSTVARLAMEMAREGQLKNYLELMPFYLRKSQAEQRRMQKIAQEE
ncbi:MAG: tRNA (adenosine(37)-N6)-threonylcarbamoyltransferase complex dimerization subunit type 1 TsaB [Xylanivirga thermophila]|jgi:tRNA threonylcarbamoyladenosine biosynthesis protein TsaB|uniref:tRNA (adenosine(37)-N6)-threonylcarbamoyltransferase complex dimerization subunit type 1 TsaB n=1 Tax=Xylanivirga thermophila TaxID=2496273 RepID=UPI00101CADE1|nr:tRNA (adenosine(37)-N6)-threonylcarbamoyltransferase complex dimerization subunit type 1 TsaB [Xylanivirga thermophila]